MEDKEIILERVCVHNLKNVSLKLKPCQFIVFTGVSGSGKSSLAFDTIFAEGQRVFIESLPSYARRHIPVQPKPKADLISGLSPAVAIEQKSVGKNPRSTAGTITGIYDYLRVIFARIGTPHCPISGGKVKPTTMGEIVDTLLKKNLGGRLIILAPFVKEKKGEFKEDFKTFLKQGFVRIRIDGVLYDITDEIISLDKNVSHNIDIVVDRLIATDEDSSKARLLESVQTALSIGNGVLSVVNTETNDEETFSESAYSPKSGIHYPPLEPENFSFNHPLGMCDTCEGIGVVETFDEKLIIAPELSIADGCCKIAGSFDTVKWGNIYENLAKLYKFSLKTPWKKLSSHARDVFLYGTEEKWTKMRFTHPVTRVSWSDYVEWRGVIHEAKVRLSSATSDVYRKKMHELMKRTECHSCKFSRLKPYPAACKLKGKTIYELCNMAIDELFEFFSSIKLTEKEETICNDMIREVLYRLRFIIDVGLNYLTLSRSSNTLSGGESQRLRLASQVGLGLTNTTYILDEPSVGLHPSDNLKLLNTLHALKDKGNNVIVVEHDEETILSADHVVDIGPHAGNLGGEIVASGSPSDIMAVKTSLTGGYLSGRLEIKVDSKKRVPGSKRLSIANANHNNLKNIHTDIPLEMCVAVTGVSGSGKSSLIMEILYPYLSNVLQRSNLNVGQHGKIIGGQFVSRVLAIDQSPIGRTPRSNPATYIKVFDEIREFYASLKTSRAFGYSAGTFSFNVSTGSCSHCNGVGMLKIDMDFMDDEWVVCDQCMGMRFNEKTLSVRYKGKNIHDVLEMTVDEALLFFQSIPPIYEKLVVLYQVGLGYIRLGQPATTLSGGEAQRVKLSRELAKKSNRKTVYILDEPTTGLHFHDVKRLVDILQQLVSNGHTVIFIEHNMEMVKCADWVIDLGPGGGNNGGQIIGLGPPEEIAKLDTATGLALRKTLTKKSSQKIKKPVLQKHKLSDNSKIVIRGANQNNLKNLSLDIDMNKISVFSGPSGSGKSSLAFETIYAEAEKRYVDSLSPYAKQFITKTTKPDVEQIDCLPPAIAIWQKRHMVNPRSTLGTMTEIYDFLRIIYARLGIPHCPETGEEIKSITPEYVVKKLLATLTNQTKMQVLARIELKRSDDFLEWKDKMQTLGFLRIRLNDKHYEIDDENIPYSNRNKNKLDLVIDRIIIKEGVSKRLHESITTASEMSGGKITIAKEDGDIFFNLDFAVESTGKSYPKIKYQTFSFNSDEGMCPECMGLGSAKQTDQNNDTTVQTCPSCDGSRLNQLARNVKINDQSICEICSMQISETLKFMCSLKHDGVIGEAIYKAKSKLQFLVDIGLNYISLDRAVSTLSNGEVQRARLAKQLGNMLTGVLYVLDEPTVSLHPHNTSLLITALKKLQNLNNTLIIVEHDPDILSICDKLYDFGPSSGSSGGFITSQGTLSEIKRDTNSLTGLFLSGSKKVFIPEQRRTPSSFLHVKNCNKHNISGLNVDIPLGVLTCVTGVSGAGKSTLIHDLIVPPLKENLRQKNPAKQFTSGKTTFINADNFNKIVSIKQNYGVGSIRSDVSTYTDMITPLKTFFSSLALSEAYGLSNKNFSFNSPSGMCKTCRGLGCCSVELHFMPKAFVKCDMCKGYKLNPLSLKAKYKGNHIGQVLKMTPPEIKNFLPPIPKLIRILDALISVGLDYIPVGQETSKLSGGEQSRLLLSRELSKYKINNTLYIFDEPTIGLHPDDIDKLLPIFHKLVDKNNTVIIIEHNLDVISNADYIIDMGPGGGSNGGKIVAQGSPEEILKTSLSLTSQHLSKRKK